MVHYIFCMHWLHRIGNKQLLRNAVRLTSHTCCHYIVSRYRHPVIYTIDSLRILELVCIPQSKFRFIKPQLMGFAQEVFLVTPWNHRNDVSTGKVIHCLSTSNIDCILSTVSNTVDSTEATHMPHSHSINSTTGYSQTSNI
jgi:hypothetical protein